MPDLAALAGDALGLGVTFKSKNAHIGGVWIDCTVSERHRFTAEVTTHPVESGSEVTDHVVAQPDEITLDCVISNKPVRPPESHANGTRPVITTVEVPPVNAKLPFGLGEAAVRVGPLGELAIKESREASVLGFDPDFDRVKDCFNELLAIKEQGRLVTVHTSLIDYSDMVITDLDVPADVTTFTSLRFQVSLRHVRIVQREVNESSLGSPASSEARAEKQVSKGKQTTKEPPVEVEQSALHALGEAGGLF